MDYSKQLSHPKWQKKRLKILERDNFTCTLCGDTKTTLHIHHEKYGQFAWSVADKYLKTRCAHCHYLEEYYKKNYSNPIPKIIKVSKRESELNYLILYVYRINRAGMKMLDIFSINSLNNEEQPILETIFSEKDVDSFFDFIKSVRGNG